MLKDTALKTRGDPIPSAQYLELARDLVHRLWSSRWMAAGVAAGVAAVTGLVMALVMPRGPITAGDALLLMAAALVTGLLAGAAMRSGWAMLLAPVAHVATFELGRVGTDGPMVDGIRLDSTWGSPHLTILPATYPER
jgi:proline iminopeptidase